MRRRAFRLAGILAGVCTAALVPLARAPIAAAVTEAEQSFLSLYFTPEELQVFSATRSLKSIDRIAENVQVVTAAEITMLNAHTVAEALELVTGLAIEARGGVGSVFSPYIQGSSFTQVAAFLDGIPLNNLTASFPELTFLPVEDIARIEVVKGPGSSVWGSALGGVVNIITKTPPEIPGVAGSAFASYGEAETADLRASVVGRAGGFGYGLWGGRLNSDGLVDGFDVDRSSVTAKLGFHASPAFGLDLAFYYTGADRGEGLYPDDEYDRTESDHLRAQLTAGGMFTGGGRLAFNLWGAWNDDTYGAETISAGSELYRYQFEEAMWGAGLRHQQSWAGHNVVLGAEYQHGRSESDLFAGELTEAQWALFANDTFKLGGTTVTAGLRWDDLESGGSFWSPSLGLVWPLGSHLLLRGYIGRGFTAPNIGAGITNEAVGFIGNPDLEVEKVVSYQGGVEGDAPGLFWYKVTFFLHDVTDGITSEADEAGNWTNVNKDEVRRQGVEIDLRSVSFHGFSLEAGGALVDAENRTSEDAGGWYADSSYRVGVKYLGPRGLRALLNVRRTHWDTPEGFAPAADPIVDLHVGQELPLAGLSFEIFGSARNLFDGEQYFNAGYPNPGRWFEAGVRCSF